jgi:hypothetical protein
MSRLHVVVTLSVLSALFGAHDAVAKKQKPTGTLQDLAGTGECAAA